MRTWTDHARRLFDGGQSVANKGVPPEGTAGIGQSAATPGPVSEAIVPAVVHVPARYPSSFHCRANRSAWAASAFLFAVESQGLTDCVTAQRAVSRATCVTVFALHISNPNWMIAVTSRKNSPPTRANSARAWPA